MLLIDVSAGPRGRRLGWPVARTGNEAASHLG